MATREDFTEPEPPQPSAAPQRSALLAVVALGLCASVELCMLATRGRLWDVIEDFELDVSLVTRLAMSWVLPGLLANVLLLAIVMEIVPVFRRVANAGHMLVVLITSVCLLIYVVGAFGPLLTLIKALS